MQPIKTALLSFGMSGRVFHEPFISIHPGFAFFAVLERTTNNAAGKCPEVITYRQLDDLLGDEAVELVIVNTPNTTHVDFALKALKAGKHVVIEKPFAATAREADELIRTAEKAGRLLTVFQNRRWDSDFRTVHQVVKDNLLGEIVEAEIHYDRYNPALSPKAHKENPGPGIGTLYDLGSHIIDQAIVLFGMPQAVFCDQQALRSGSRIDDYNEVLLYYPSLRVRIKTSYLVKEPIPAYVLHGRNGSFIKPRADTQEVRLQAGEIPNVPDWGTEPVEVRGFLHTVINGKTIREPIPTLSGNYLEFYDRLYNAIRLKQAPPVLPSDSRLVIYIIEKAIESAHAKKVIDL